MKIPPRAPDDLRNTTPMLRRQLIADGWSDRAISRQLRGGAWRRLRHGAYVPSSVWDELDDAGRHGLRARAAQLQSSTDVVLSHTSGLPEYDAPTWGLDLNEVHLTREDGKVGRREAGVCQHCGAIADGDVVTRNGVRVMSGTRLSLEVTTVAGVEASLCVVNHMLHQGHTTPVALQERYASMKQWPRTLTTDLVLRLSDARVETVGESRCYHLCFHHRLPLPVPQYEVRDPATGTSWRLDFAWPELGVWLEFDGMVKYEALLKPGERASDVVIREKAREDLIRQITGWRCIRITWDDLQHPERTAALIRAALFPAAAA
jgi:hypothetical protein